MGPSNKTYPFIPLANLDLNEISLNGCDGREEGFDYSRKTLERVVEDLIPSSRYVLTRNPLYVYSGTYTREKTLDKHISLQTRKTFQKKV